MAWRGDEQATVLLRLAVLCCLLRVVHPAEVPKQLAHDIFEATTARAQAARLPSPEAWAGKGCGRGADVVVAVVGQYRTFKWTRHAVRRFLDTMLPATECWLVAVSVDVRPGAKYTAGDFKHLREEDLDGVALGMRGVYTGEFLARPGRTPAHAADGPGVFADAVVERLLDADVGLFEGRLAYVVTSRSSQWSGGGPAHATYSYAAYALASAAHVRAFGTPPRPDAVVANVRADVTYTRPHDLRGLRAAFELPPWHLHLAVAPQLDPQNYFFTSFAAYERDIAVPLSHRGSSARYAIANLYMRSMYADAHGRPECSYLEGGGAAPAGEDGDGTVSCAPYVFNIPYNENYCRFPGREGEMCYDTLLKDWRDDEVVDVALARAVLPRDECAPHAFPSRRARIPGVDMRLNFSLAYLPGHGFLYSVAPRPLAEWSEIFAKHMARPDGPLPPPPEERHECCDVRWCDNGGVEFAGCPRFPWDEAVRPCHPEERGSGVDPAWDAEERAAAAAHRRPR